MAADSPNVLETIKLDQGLDIDVDEAWRKLIERQFGGEPGRAAAELLQNAVDSYPLETPGEERWVKIETGSHTLAMTDYGEGMSRERLALLLTLGGTDKNDLQRIGRFGIGFFSIFSPALNTRKVRVVTRCEGYVVEMVFHVNARRCRPKISARRLDEEIDFRTRIEVTFDNRYAVGKCMTAMKQYLRFYRCMVTVNNVPNRSIWDEARQGGALFFKQGHCDGFLDTTHSDHRVNVLCKYEYITCLSLAALITGGHNMTYDLRDYCRKDLPFLPNVWGTVNCNNLDVTISRDGFYLNWSYSNLVRAIAQALMQHLHRKLQETQDPQLVLANQYVLQGRLKACLRKIQSGDTTALEDDAEAGVMRFLLEAKVYRINGRKELFSLMDLMSMLSKDAPLFFSDRQSNLNWLGGDYKHDFVVLPTPCRYLSGAPDFYDTLFGCIFEDIVNLDNIAGDNCKIRKLVERGIIDKEALMPKCTVVADRQVTEKEAQLLAEIDEILVNPEVQRVIERTLHIRVGRIRSVLFDVEEREITIATGAFDEAGRALREYLETDESADTSTVGNMTIEHGKETQNRLTILLGLRRDHPFIEHLIESDDPHRAYYGLTFLAHELALCQKRLVPHSPFFHLVKERLAADMREALMMQLIGERSTDVEAA